VKVKKAFSPVSIIIENGTELRELISILNGSILYYNQTCMGRTNVDLIKKAQLLIGDLQK